jgi:glycosyltransferase involved in cell wall biosynthesis
VTHVLILDQFSELGGAQFCLLDLIPALRDSGWEVHVAAPDGGPLAVECRARGATFDPIHCGPYSRGGKSPADLFRFAADFHRLRSETLRLSDRYKVRLLYVNGPRLLPAASSAARGLLPMVFHCHSHLHQRYAAWLAGRALRRENATVIASCRFVTLPLSRYVELRRWYVVYNGVPEPAHLHGGFAPNGAWRVGAIGRISPEKGQAEFLEAARLLLKVRPDCRFVVCGAALGSDPATARYAARVRQLAAGLPVEFTGWQQDVSAVLAKLDVLVAPSLPGEGTTRVILEAYAAGVPVVATASGGIPEVLNDGETGFLAERFTPYALANRIHVLLSASPGRLREFSENARAAWRQKYTLDRYRRQIVEILDGVIDAWQRR